MSKLKIRVHESKVSRIRNQDEFEKWLENAKSHEREFETIHKDYP